MLNASYMAVSHAASLITWNWPLHSSGWLKGTSVFKSGVRWFRLIEVCLLASLPSVFHGNRGIAYPLFLSWGALYMVDYTLFLCVCVGCPCTNRVLINSPLQLVVLYGDWRWGCKSRLKGALLYRGLIQPLN